MFVGTILSMEKEDDDIDDPANEEFYMENGRNDGASYNQFMLPYDSLQHDNEIPTDDMYSVFHQINASKEDLKRKVTLLRRRLIAAICSNKADIVKYILQEDNLNPNFIMNKRSPICLALAVENVVIVELLLDAGAEVKEGRASGSLCEKYPVHLAASKGHLEMLQLLVERGCEINQCDDEKRTPLHWAAVHGHVHLIKWMLEAGAEVNKAETDGFTALHTAACLGHLNMCRLLVEGGADLSITDRTGWTPLCDAVSFGYPSVVELLLEKGADPMQTTTSSGDSVLHIACSSGNVEMVELLLNAGVPIESTNYLGFTPLLTAVNHNNKGVAPFLIRAGANVNAKTCEGKSSLQLAAVHWNFKILHLLITAGAHVQTGTYLPMKRHFSSLSNHLEILASSPRSLADLCLLIIRQMLAPSLQTKVKHLPLPRAVMRAVAMEVVTQCSGPVLTYPCPEQ